jgi:hypothetical protein
MTYDEAKELESMLLGQGYYNIGVIYIESIDGYEVSVGGKN